MQNFKTQIKYFFTDSTQMKKALNLSKDKLQELIIQKRLEHLQESADYLKFNLSSQGRCPKCTLTIPCRHYDTPVSIPQPQPKSLSPISVSGPKSLTKIYKNPQETKNRLQVKEKIQDYRENKLNQELVLAKDAEKQEYLKKCRQRSEEIKRKKYFELQREKIRLYKDEKQRGLTTSSKSSRVKTKKKFKFHNKVEEIDSILQNFNLFLS